MTNEKQNDNGRCKIVFLFDYEVQTLLDAIITTQNAWGDKRNGNVDWDQICETRIAQLESVFGNIIKTSWKDLPTPTKES